MLLLPNFLYSCFFRVTPFITYWTYNMKGVTWGFQLSKYNSFDSTCLSELIVEQKNLGTIWTLSFLSFQSIPHNIRHNFKIVLLTMFLLQTRIMYVWTWHWQAKSYVFIMLWNSFQLFGLWLSFTSSNIKIFINH